MLYQINTRVWLTELSEKLGRAATLDDIPDAELDRFGQMGFKWLWLLSVWQTGAAGRVVSRSNPGWRQEFEATLPDLTEDDIAGSGFAICDYKVHDSLGGEAALIRIRERLRQRGVKLLLDFVPNHMALDNKWVSTNPEYFIGGTDDDIAAAPDNFTAVVTNGQSLIFAHGRDPYFPGWPDTLQLDYSNAATQKAMIGELLRIAEHCDGVRCDMAMLVLPDIFERTWGRKTQPFWPEATRCVRSKFPDFVFMAEVYWDLEWTLQQQGFDFTYDKRLYDRLRDGEAKPVADHLHGDIQYQNKMTRFLENHDEPRAASAFTPNMHKAAAVISFLAPGLPFIHQGQLEGRLKKISPHLIRAPQEPADPDIQSFYQNLLTVLRLPLPHQGQWQMLNCFPAWEGNWTNDCFICYAWQRKNELMVVAVNYAGNQSQCYVPLLLPTEGEYCLKDHMGAVIYERTGRELIAPGLYLDLAPWQYHVFTVSKVGASIPAKAAR